ncbi:50S ribosomal protein L4 [Candidatus Bathyarchaeota archaeon]|nr:MAG: 50S ribosomal protein L4 [Crenarchaeota archaeon 13_1_40CM_3_53_5]TMI24097.1 MAG: 50S ribosomal protein L4 [Candidatus Bathyarchaeota archaeon]TMI32026.1 MAG: 50S ribosomal protein L4 [Candidatus Bathyarchaeota archaeon]
MQSSPRTARVLDAEGKQAGEITLPPVFTERLRLDVIKKAVVAQQSHRFQAQGRNRMAGKRTTAEGFGVGRGISRVPRIGGGGPLSGTAAFAPGTVGGRNAFPPVPWKRTAKRINRKERTLALRSAIAATASRDMVMKRGHRVEDGVEFPLVSTDDFEKFSKASEARRFLGAIGLWDDILRVNRSREPHRGRTLHSVGPLLVVEEYRGAEKAFENFQGVQVVRAKDLSVEALAPGTHPGRLTVWSESAIKTLAGRGSSS